MGANERSAQELNCREAAAVRAQSDSPAYDATFRAEDITDIEKTGLACSVEICR